ncbi:anti-sigma factor [Streptomyces chartreusis]|uniref:Regulator of SigK n=1 Tax=Streptomyces chartreusis TaxID=1969 RepID=A0A7H8T4J9_STRCX|nr:anti-sigma factor [Streptomyces chartreusis]QKZ18387.1 anti-sigma factor [Streptomyces chartreusis]
MTPDDDPHLAAGAYALHALPADEEADFERHLDACPACRREVAELTEAAARLALDGTEQADVPDDLLDRVLREIGRTPQDQTHLRPLPGGRYKRLMSWALAASVAAAAAFGGIAAWQYTRAEDARAQAATLQSGKDRLTRVLTAPDATLHTGELSGGASAAVVVSRADNQAAFVAAGLPPLSNDKVYELWYANPSGDLSPAGLLPGSGNRPARVLDRPLGETVAVGVTVEPAGGSAQPTTEPLGIISIS